MNSFAPKPLEAGAAPEAIVTEGFAIIPTMSMATQAGFLLLGCPGVPGPPGRWTGESLVWFAYLRLGGSVRNHKI